MVLYTSICIYRYVIPKEYAEKFEKLAKKIARKRKCNLYLRHKVLMIPPSVLEQAGIKFGRVCIFPTFCFQNIAQNFLLTYFLYYCYIQIIQRPGQFVISLPGTYHSGFNLGFNEAESVNFGSETWLELFEGFKTCSCK